jgi:hypothetical protein
MIDRTTSDAVVSGYRRLARDLLVRQGVWGDDLETRATGWPDHTWEALWHHIVVLSVPKPSDAPENVASYVQASQRRLDVLMPGWRSQVSVA